MFPTVFRHGAIVGPGHYAILYLATNTSRASGCEVARLTFYQELSPVR
jgi:hypothetical protein